MRPTASCARTATPARSQRTTTRAVAAEVGGRSVRNRSASGPVARRFPPSTSRRRVPMPSPYVEPLPRGLMKDDAGGFVASVEDTDLVYFLLNVGDGDCQVILLPMDAKTERRQAIVVDVANFKKVEGLLRQLEASPLFSDQAAAA